MEDFKDFKIRRGLSTTLFSAPGIVNERLLIEEGYWYLCIDTAELFLGVRNKVTSKLELIRVNAKNAPTKLSELINDCEFITRIALNEALEALNIPEVPTKLSQLENDLGYLTEHQDLSEYAKIADIPSHEGLATETFVLNKIAEAELNDKDVDLTGFVTKDDLLAVEDKIPVVDGLASEIYVDTKIDSIVFPELPKKISELENDLGYLTEHQDLSEYAKREELPSVDGLASEDFVAESIAAIKIPETDLSEYSTTTEITAAIETAVIEKADEIPFATTKVVNTQLGNFITGEDLKGLTIAEIFAKLLGLTDTPVEDPEVPDEPQGIVAEILAKQIPMHAVTATGNVEIIPYKLITLSEDIAKTAPTESGFYQIKNTSGTVVESGYQLLSSVYLDMPFLISLPKALDFNTQVETQSWNDLEQRWETKVLPLSSDVQEFISIMGQSPYDTFTNIDPETHTIWFNTSDGSTGACYRFIIHE